MRSKVTTKIFFLILTIILAIGNIAHAASGIQNVTTTSITNVPSTAETHPTQNAWIYTKLDSTGYTQVYYQFLTGSETDGSATLAEIPLTTTTFDKSMAKWGASASVDIDYVDSSTGTNTQCKGQDFYYLGDTDRSDHASDGNKEIHFGCFDGISTSPIIVFDVRLTEYGPSTDGVDTTYNVNDYDVSHSASALNIISTLPPAYTNTFPVVFTTTDGQLHFLMHSATTMYSEDTNDNATTGTILYDHTDVRSFYRWHSSDRASASQFTAYKTPRFDANGHNITFLGIPKSGTYTDRYQVGIVWATGRNEYQITDLPRTLTNPQFYGSITDTSSVASVDHLFFEYAEESPNKGQLVHVPVTTNVLGTSNWCSVAYVLTNNTATRANMQTKFIDTGTSVNNTLFAYQLTQADGNRDIYMADVRLFLTCTGAASGTTPITAPIELNQTAINLAGASFDFDEHQLTCQQDNTDPQILPNIYFSNPFAYYGATSAEGFTDFIFSRTQTDGSGTSLAHLYNIADSTDECANTCYEKADGTPFSSTEDANSDGVLDSCVPETVVCNADYLTTHPTEDYDSDSILNYIDNCPCSYNPHQTDADADGVGDVFELENGCDNCPGVFNPGTLDNNGNGNVGAVTDLSPADSVTPLPYSGGFTDGDVRQTDSDHDGYGDACDLVPNECGETDTDGDGVFDLCDNCVLVANSDQRDSNGDNVGDVCMSVVDPCGTGTGTFTYDTNNDGIADSCVAPQITTEPSGWYFHGSSIFDRMGCALNPQAVTGDTSSKQALLFVILSLVSFRLAASRRHKNSSHGK